MLRIYNIYKWYNGYKKIAYHDLFLLGLGRCDALHHWVRLTANDRHLCGFSNSGDKTKEENGQRQTGWCPVGATRQQKPFETALKSDRSARQLLWPWGSSDLEFDLVRHEVVSSVAQVNLKWCLGHLWLNVNVVSWPWISSFLFSETSIAYHSATLNFKWPSAVSTSNFVIDIRVIPVSACGLFFLILSLLWCKKWLIFLCVLKVFMCQVVK